MVLKTPSKVEQGCRIIIIAKLGSPLCHAQRSFFSTSSFFSSFLLSTTTTPLSSISSSCWWKPPMIFIVQTPPSSSYPQQQPNTKGKCRVRICPYCVASRREYCVHAHVINRKYFFQRSKIV